VFGKTVISPSGATGQEVPRLFTERKICGLKALVIGLAVLDFAPVFFLALGLLFLAQLVDRLEPRSRRVALAGLVLIVLGGFGRAVSNLVFGVTGEALPMLAATLHVFGGPGFALMATALHRSRAAARGNPNAGDPWIAPMAVTWLFLAAAFFLNLRFPGEGGSLVLEGLALVGVGGLCFSSAILSWRRQLHMAAGLFAMNAIGTTAVAALRLTDQNIWIQILEVVVHTAIQGGFSFAAWRVAAEYQARVGPIAAK